MPRPRIIPSWVHEGLQQSSVSVDDDSDGESASSSTSSSLEPAQFRKSLGAAKERALAVKQHGRGVSNAASHATGAVTGSGGLESAKMRGGRTIAGMATTKGGGGAGVGTLLLGNAGMHQPQRVALGRAGRRLTDTGERG